MINLNYSIKINAPREKVWDVMLSDETYREWTMAFHPGSSFRGTWEEGTKMEFVAPGENGVDEVGMAGMIKENRKPEFLSIEYSIPVPGLEINPEGPMGYENYTFKDDNGATDLVIDLLNLPDEFKDMMSDSWPKALDKLKEICER